MSCPRWVRIDKPSQGILHLRRYTGEKEALGGPLLSTAEERADFFETLRAWDGLRHSNVLGRLQALSRRAGWPSGGLHVRPRPP